MENVDSPPEVSLEALQLGIMQLCMNMFQKLVQLGNEPAVAMGALKDFLRTTADILEEKEE
jgi:hypothetical protein